jgi:hypothetical protein
LHIVAEVRKSRTDHKAITIAVIYRYRRPQRTRPCTKSDRVDSQPLRCSKPKVDYPHIAHDTAATVKTAINEKAATRRIEGASEESSPYRLRPIDLKLNPRVRRREIEFIYIH